METITEADRIQEALRELDSHIVELRQAISVNPNEAWALKHNIRAFQSQRKSLLQQLDDLAVESGCEVCSYRIADCSAIGIADLGDSLISFQQVFSVVYAAQHEGPRLTSKIGDDVANKTKLIFNHSFSGSVGISMVTSSSDFQLFESDIKFAVEMIVALTKCESEEEVQVLSKSLGAGCMRQLYKWCKVHSDLNTGIEIIWKSFDKEDSTYMIPRARFHSLERILVKVSEISEETLSYAGTLVGADVKTKSFHFVSEGGDIRGKLGHELATSSTVESQRINLPVKVMALIVRRSEIRFASESETVNYELLKIEPPQATEQTGLPKNTEPRDI